jgi:hypothetical protein
MSRSRKAGGSVFGLALVSVLVFGAFAASAAQASPVWHKNGKTFKELGISEVGTVLTGGSLTIEVPGWDTTINCKQNFGTGHLVGESSGTMHIEARECGVANMEKSCKVGPLSFVFNLGLVGGGKTGTIETFTPYYSEMEELEITGTYCPLEDLIFPLMYEAGSMGAEVGAESTHLSLTGLPANQIEAGVSGELALVSFGGSFLQTEALGWEIGAW